MFVRSVLTAAALLTAVPALAVDFSKPITQIDGTTPLRDDKQAIYSLGDVAETALLTSYQDEGNLDGVEKNKRFWIAKKIHDQRKDPVLTADEIALIKKLIAKAYNPLVTGQAWTLLDPASAAK